MYTIVLGLHNIVRWIVLVLAIVAVGRSWMGWLGKRNYTEGDRKTGVYFGASIDTQILLGLILYFFLSPITKAALQHLSTMMSDANSRFFGFEHVLYMLVAAVLAHLGSILPRRQQEAVAKHRLAAICFTLAVLAIILGIPWTRPLIPFLR